MAKDPDLRHWLRYPGNVTGRDLIREAERRGWLLDRVRGDHFFYRNPRTGKSVAIDRGTKASPTKRRIIEALMEEAGDDQS